jgi:hypothetical protein
MFPLRGFMMAECKLANLLVPEDRRGWAKSWRRRKRFVNRSITHTASDLPADHEMKIAIFKEKLLQFVTVRMTFLEDFSSHHSAQMVAYHQ